jgi:hypothetical protein
VVTYGVGAFSCAHVKQRMLCGSAVYAGPRVIPVLFCCVFVASGKTELSLLMVVFYMWSSTLVNIHLFSKNSFAYLIIYGGVFIVKLIIVFGFSVNVKLFHSI